MATFKRWNRAVIHHVSARTVIVEYPTSVKIVFREEEQGQTLFIRINAKPIKEEGRRSNVKSMATSNPRSSPIMD